MSERFKKLFTLSNSLYTSGSPVVIKAGALLLDTATTNVLAQLKFQSIDSRKIIALDLALQAKDTSGNPIGDEFVFQYLNIAIAQGGEFGSQTPVFLPDNNTRSYSPFVKKVYFENGESWEGNETEWTRLATPTPIDEAIKSETALREYRTALCKNAAFAVVTDKDVWQCSCGVYNPSSAPSCAVCHAELMKMLAATPEALEKDATYRKAVALLKQGSKDSLAAAKKSFGSIAGWKDTNAKLELIKKKEKELEKRAKKTKLFIALGAILLAFIIFLSAMIPIAISGIATAMWQNENYKQAVKTAELLSDKKTRKFVSKHADEINDAFIAAYLDDDDDLAMTLATWYREYRYEDVLYDIMLLHNDDTYEKSINMTKVLAYLNDCGYEEFAIQAESNIFEIQEMRELDGYWISYSGKDEYGSRLYLAEDGYYKFSIEDGVVHEGTYSEYSDSVVLYKGNFYIVSDFYADDFTIWETEYFYKITSVGRSELKLYKNSLDWTINLEK